MGCTSSKQGRKHSSARASWYAPLSRSTSEPIHYQSEDEEEISHVVSLTSSSYGIMKMERHGEGIMMNTDKHGERLADKFMEHCNRRSSSDGAGQDSHSLHGLNSKQLISSLKLKPVMEMPEGEGDLETINTWELMEGLEDGEDLESHVGSDDQLPHHHTQDVSPVGHSSVPCAADSEASMFFKAKGAPKRRAVEKSLSFSIVHGLDSCFAEIGSPMWEKDQCKSNMDVCGQDASLCLSAYSKQHDTFQCLKSPVRSPLKSPLKGSESPLFDPSLLNVFEQSLQAANLSEGDWMVLNPTTIGNTSSSSSSSLSSSSVPSSDNNIWASSETSSDAESSNLELSGTVGEDHLKDTLDRKAWPVMFSPLRKRAFPDLYSFEVRCPPRGEEKVVLYFTSLRGVRKTYEDCCMLRLILQGLGVHVDERDVWMHSRFREELTDLLGSKRLQVPRLFIKGRYIGGAEEVKQLHEDGALIRLIEDLPTFGLFRKVCDGCGDVRFIPCLTCSGSCKVLDQLDCITRCSECNENGLMMCPMCS